MTRASPAWTWLAPLSCEAQQSPICLHTRTHPSPCENSEENQHRAIMTRHTHVHTWVGTRLLQQHRTPYVWFEGCMRAFECLPRLFLAEVYFLYVQSVGVRVLGHFQAPADPNLQPRELRHLPGGVALGLRRRIGDRGSASWQHPKSRSWTTTLVAPRCCCCCHRRQAVFCF